MPDYDRWFEWHETGTPCRIMTGQWVTWIRNTIQDYDRSLSDTDRGTPCRNMTDHLNDMDQGHHSGLWQVIWMTRVRHTIWVTWIGAIRHDYDRWFEWHESGTPYRTMTGHLSDIDRGSGYHAGIWRIFRVTWIRNTIPDYDRSFEWPAYDRPFEWPV